jgi:hypothetical protein
VKLHPEIRRDLTLGVFWDDEHLAASGALAGVIGARFNPLLLGLAAPYVVRVLSRRGPGLRSRAIAAAELPGAFVRQGAEVVGLAVGSVRHRTLVL